MNKILFVWDNSYKQRHSTREAETKQKQQKIQQNRLFETKSILIIYDYLLFTVASVVTTRT